MHNWLIQEVGTMKPFVQFLSSKLSDMGVRVWARLSLGPTPVLATASGSAPERGAGARL